MRTSLRKLRRRGNHEDRVQPPGERSGLPVGAHGAQPPDRPAVKEPGTVADRSSLARPRAGAVHPALVAYLEQLPELAAAYQPSVFWQKQLDKLKQSAAAEHKDALAPEDLEHIVRLGSYGFSDLPAGIPSPTADPEYREALDKLKDVRTALRTMAPDAIGVSKGQWEHLTALLYLGTQTLLAEYEAFLAPLGVRSSMSVARHFVYKREIERLASEHLGDEPLDVIEIGAGAGNLAFFLACTGRVRSYCIVDLPEILVHSAYTIQKYLPEAAIAFNEEPSDRRGGAPSFWFLSAQFADRIPDARCNLALNFNSFMEMDGETRDDYIRLIYRACRPGAVLYNVNRRQRALPRPDGSSFDNNPLLYPYQPDDHILFWEEDAFQQATRSRLGSLPSLTIARAALINQG